MKMVKRIIVMAVMMVALASAAGAEPLPAGQAALVLDISFASKDLFNYTYKNYNGEQVKLDYIMLKLVDVSDNKHKSIWQIVYHNNADIRDISQTISVVPGRSYTVSISGAGGSAVVFINSTVYAQPSGNFTFTKNISLIPPVLAAIKVD